jgi:hypothetical protein
VPRHGVFAKFTQVTKTTNLSICPATFVIARTVVGFVLDRAPFGTVAA